MSAKLYFDLGSPYSYLAFERAPAVLGAMPELEPIALGPIFKARGDWSWGMGPRRAAEIAEVERRAALYGLPRVAWPAGWPTNTLNAMRIAVWAGRHGALEAFARAGFRAAFVDGRDLADLAELARVAGSVDLDPEAVATVVADDVIKAALRAATDAAWQAGVRGAPTVIVGGVPVFGDDRLEEAAALASP